VNISVTKAGYTWQKVAVLSFMAVRGGGGGVGESQLTLRRGSRFRWARC